MCHSAAASEPKQPDAASGSGIEGVITIALASGPTRPGVSDSRPLPNATFVVRQDDQTITTFTTNAEGQFKVPLPPGRYSVTMQGQRRPQPGFYGPFEVEVTAGKMSQVSWKCDSGMQ